MIKLFDAESGALFASVEADDEGDWWYKKRHLSAIPCRVRAISGNDSDEKNVEHADEFPGNCGIGGVGIIFRRLRMPMLLMPLKLECLSILIARGQPTRMGVS